MKKIVKNLFFALNFEECLLLRKFFFEETRAITRKNKKKEQRKQEDFISIKINKFFKK